MALHMRHRLTENLSDLDDALDADRAALLTNPTNLSLRVGNLGSSLLERYQRTKDPKDLRTAVSAARTALSMSPPGRSDRPFGLGHIGNALLQQYLATGQQADIDEAVRHLRAAVRATPAGHPDAAVRLANLGTALEARFEGTKRPADLKEWIEVSADAVRRLPADHPDQARFRTKHANALQARYRLTAEPEDREAAVAALLGAWAATSSRARFRLYPAGAAARLLAESPGGRRQAASLLEAATRLFPELTPHFLTRTDQQYVLEGASGLAANAAALIVNDPSRPDTERGALALQLLETGRAVMLAQTLDTRTDLADLREQHPTLDALLPEADHGPIATFNISRYGSAALLLTGTGIVTVPLPGLGLPTLAEKVTLFRQALAAANSPTPAERTKAQPVLTDILKWLWDVAAGPVLEALGHHRQPSPGTPWPRLWWAPGGLLGLLPLHAAGYHADPAHSPGRRSVLDRMVSSYTPTIRTLHHARRRVTAPADARALVVSLATVPHLPDAPNEGALLFASDETAAVLRHLPDATVLIEPRPGSEQPPSALPTRANVAAHLPACAFAHFICHGLGNAHDPSLSRLILHDHTSDPFTVAALMPLTLDRAQLAYLSACDTARTLTPDLLDEAIHLASAFQLAGFPHVVGTMWSVTDETSVTLADTFYAFLTSNGTHAPDARRSAHALHHAVRALRDGHDMPDDLTRIASPSIWAGYLHSGA